MLPDIVLSAFTYIHIKYSLLYVIVFLSISIFILLLNLPRLYCSYSKHQTHMKLQRGIMFAAV